jgi:hypothetical protein
MQEELEILRPKLADAQVETENMMEDLKVQ